MEAGERDRVGVVATKEVAILAGCLGGCRQAAAQMVALLPGSCKGVVGGWELIDSTTTAACSSCASYGTVFEVISLPTMRLLSTT